MESVGLYIGGFESSSDLWICDSEKNPEPFVSFFLIRFFDTSFHAFTNPYIYTSFDILRHPTIFPKSNVKHDNYFVFHIYYCEGTINMHQSRGSSFFTNIEQYI
jgi:hypothetical protein